MAKKVKYVVDESKRTQFPEPLFETVVIHRVNAVEVEKYKKKHGRLPAHVSIAKDEDDEQ
jgi:hypothetical protein